MTNMLIIIIGLLVYNYYWFIGIQLLLVFNIYKIPFISSRAWKFKVEGSIDG